MDNNRPNSLKENLKEVYSDKNKKSKTEKRQEDRLFSKIRSMIKKPK